MELDARKLQILRAVIDEYILSAAPVGSRSVSKRSGLNLSSATIRNEMADLEEMGYLEQPHTSAGRIPSDRGYRVYVDGLMHRSNLTEDEIGFIRSHYSRRIGELEAVMQQTAAALSEATQYTAVVMRPELNFSRLKHMQLVPLAEGRALLVVVTDTGYSKDCIVSVPERFTPMQLEQLSHLLTERLSGVRMDRVPELLKTELSGIFAERQEFLSSVIASLEQEMASKSGKVTLSGATKMLHYPEYSDVTKARTFLAAVEGRDNLYGMLKKASPLEFTFTIGSENELEPLQDCSVVTATYRIGGMPVGTMGVIGPTRMNYGKVVSVLEFMSRSLSEILSNYIEEDEKP